MPSSVNMRTGTQVGLGMSWRGCGGVYRVDDVGRLRSSGVVAQGGTRPPGTQRVAGVAKAATLNYTQNAQPIARAVSPAVPGPVPSRAAGARACFAP